MFHLNIATFGRNSIVTLYITSTTARSFAAEEFQQFPYIFYTVKQRYFFSMSSPEKSMYETKTYDRNFISVIKKITEKNEIAPLTIQKGIFI